MIKHVRVDNRLIHGQTVIMWTKVIETNRIVLISDSVANNPNQLMIMELVSPPGIKVDVLDENTAKEKINSNFYGDEKIFVITPSLYEVENMVNVGADISEIYIGNQAYKPGNKKLTRNVSLSDDEIQIIKNLQEKKIKVNIQTLPSEKCYDAAKLVENLK